MHVHTTGVYSIVYMYIDLYIIYKQSVYLPFTTMCMHTAGMSRELDVSDSESYRRGEKRSLDEEGTAISVASKRSHVGMGQSLFVSLYSCHRKSCQNYQYLLSCLFPLPIPSPDQVDLAHCVID